MSDKKNITRVSLIFLAATLVSFMVVNRWVVARTGVGSFGRLWQFYVSYMDFGFVRRAFIGTFFSGSGLNTLLSNEYHFAFLVHHVAIALLAFIISYFCIAKKITDPLFLASVAFSPALIIQSGWTTGTLDIFVILLSTANILFIRNIAIFSAIIIAGVLTHETFCFTVPAQIFALWKHNCEFSSPPPSPPL